MRHAQPLALDRDALDAYLLEIFPEYWGDRSLELMSVAEMSATLKLNHRKSHLRPGGTISGPAMFALADVALYCALLAQIGRVRLAVTTNLNINFLRKPEAGDLMAEARLLKLGKSAAVGEVLIHAAGQGSLVAHATGAYAVPALDDDGRPISRRE